MHHVLVADDHEVTRRGLREIITDAFENAEVSEAEDAAAVLRLLPTRDWDLLLLDVLMPGGDIRDVLAQVREAFPKTPVLALTAHTELEYVIQVMKSGANGLIHKHLAADELLGAIRQVVAGKDYLHPETAAALAASLRDPQVPTLHDKLSDRELEIFRHIALGKAVKEIAADLQPSDKTVATYLSRIREKTGLTSHVEIARYALRHGLVD